MSNLSRLQEIHKEIRAMKKERKEIQSAWKDELAHHDRYQEVLEEAGKLKEEKREIETSIRSQSPHEAQRVEELAQEIKSQEELLSDLAVNLLMADETVELSDEDNNRYVPQFVVRFKKDGIVKADGV